MTAATLSAAVVLGVVHLVSRYLTVFDRWPRSAWLSAASGVSLAYVFVHLLPEIAAVQSSITDDQTLLPALERHAWLLALVGLGVFYSLQQWAQTSRRSPEGATTPDRVGGIHVASYAAYNALVGYLLHDQAERPDSSLALFTIAMALHFMVNDHGLRADHGRLYHDRGRYVLAAAVVVGWAVGQVVVLPEAAVGLPIAFLGGSIILIVLKEELPSERQSRLIPLIAGAAMYAALLILV